MLPANYLNNRSTFSNPLLWGALVLYILLAGFTIANHELWMDEMHSWNIAKGSNSYADLIHNTRYEGHPPVWYSVLWVISKFTHNLSWVQFVHVTFACASVFLILFLSPFSLLTRLLIPFGYFFLFEYAVLSRNYAIGILLALCICMLLYKNYRYKIPLYYVLLFLLTNTHLLALILAGSIHGWFLLSLKEQKKKISNLGLHIVLGLLVALPACYFIFPPSDSQLSAGFWINRWQSHNVNAFVQAPLRAFMPMPAWWNTSFWHTQFLIEVKDQSFLLKGIYLVTSTLLTAAAFIILRKNKKSLYLFSVNFLVTFIIAVLVFPLTSARYAGFLFIALIIALWFYCHEQPLPSKNKWLLYALLGIHLAGGIFSVVNDIRRPFSYAYAAREMLDKVPRQEKLVTDYWAMNIVSAYIDKPIYCIDIQKEVSFVLWNGDLENMVKKQYRYCSGLEELFAREPVDKVYMFSTGSPETISRVDAKLFKAYTIELVEKREGAIEKGSNLFLYLIKKKE